MNSRTVTQNRTYNHDKQTNQNTKVHRHWAQEGIISKCWAQFLNAGFFQICIFFQIYIYIYFEIYKVGAMVIMDTDNYIKKANQQLSDKANCKQLFQDPTLQRNRMANQKIERLKNKKLLPQKIEDDL